MKVARIVQLILGLATLTSSVAGASNRYAGKYEGSIPVVVFAVPTDGKKETKVFKNYIWGIEIIKLEMDGAEVSGEPAVIHFQYHDYDTIETSGTDAFLYVVPFDALISSPSPLKEIMSLEYRLVRFSPSDSDWRSLLITYRARYPDGTESKVLKVSLSSR